MNVKILIADGCRIMRQGVDSLLDNEPDMEVIGEAENERTAVQLAHEFKPDIIVMGIEMSNLNGVEAIRQIAQKLPDTKIIAFSACLDNRFVREIFKAGALGYVWKQCDYEELASAIRTVASGQTYLSPKITDIVVKGCIDRLPYDDNSPYLLLTAKEREVLQLIAEGKSTGIIAAELNICTRAVGWRRSKIMHKLNMQSIAELTKYAIREGITGVYV